jgi:hypothetical protein
MEKKYPITYKKSADIRNAVKCYGNTLKCTPLEGHRGKKKIKRNVMSHKS